MIKTKNHIFLLIYNKKVIKLVILTIKRLHGLDLEKELELKEFLRQGNIVKRCALNYYKKNKGAKLSDCENYLKSLNNIDLINASWIKSISNSIKNINEIEHNLIGPRYLLNKLQKRDYKTEEERINIKKQFNLIKNSQLLLMRGSKSDPNTNRCGKFTLENNILYLEFYINKNNKYKFAIDNIERNQLDDLIRLNELIKQKIGYFNIGISGKEIFIQYDNSILIEKHNDLIHGRKMAIDLNPYDIGVVVMESNNIISETVFKIEDLIKNRDANKTDNELSFLSKTLVDISLHYKCGSIVVEKLKLKNSKVKLFNEWNIQDTIQSLNKWCDYYGVKFEEVNAFYSSFMGIYYNPNKIDSIASAIELGIRSFMASNELIDKRTKLFLSSEVLIDELPNRWKKEVINIKKYIGKTKISFKDIYSSFKSNSNKYYRVRVRFSEVEKYFIGNSLKSIKSLIKIFDTNCYQMLDMV